MSILYNYKLSFSMNNIEKTDFITQGYKEEVRTIRLQQFFHANGIDETNVRDRHIKKSESYSNSQILPRDYERIEEIVLVIKEMAEHLAIRLRKGKKLAGGLSLWVRHSYQSKCPID